MCEILNNNEKKISANRCKCLGDYKVANYSIQALDLYCRNDTFKVMPSVYRDPATQEPIDQVVPNKTRCGSQDPVEMSADTKCYCWPKERRGARKTFLLLLCIHYESFLFIQARKYKRNFSRNFQRNIKNDIPYTL